MSAQEVHTGVTVLPLVERFVTIALVADRKNMAKKIDRHDPAANNQFFSNLSQGSSQDVGTQIQSNGDIQLQAGNNVNAKAAQAAAFCDGM